MNVFRERKMNVKAILFAVVGQILTCFACISFYSRQSVVATLNQVSETNLKQDSETTENKLFGGEQVDEHGCSTDKRIIEDCNLGVKEAMESFEFKSSKLSLVDSPFRCKIRFPEGSRGYEIGNYCLQNDTTGEFGTVVLNFTEVDHVCDLDFTSRKLMAHVKKNGLKLVVTVTCTERYDRTNWNATVNLPPHSCLNETLQLGKFTLIQRFQGVIVQGKVKFSIEQRTRAATLLNTSVKNADAHGKPRYLCQGDEKLLSACTCLATLPQFSNDMVRIFTESMSCHAFPRHLLALYTCLSD